MTEGTRAAGEAIGNFEIERFLARGGVGEVYVARSTINGERVALKLLADFSPAAAVRFERESRILRRITHPHIVARRDSGRTVDGLPFLAMELLDGEALDSLLARRAVSTTAIVDLVLQVCDALSVAHAHGVVHRDIKPSNIFVCRGEQLDARLLDFGIARLAGERALTVTGGAIGTWVYMSPEQASGERDIDARTDVWSLGVVLYEALSHTIPFAADAPPAMLYKIIFDEPPPLATRAPHVPTALADVVMRCLEKKREMRFATVDALAAALKSLRGELDNAMTRATNDGARSGERISILPALSVDTTGENRLVSVVFLVRIADRVLVERLAGDFGGRFVALTGGGALVLFGVDAWTGNEPVRAVRFAMLASSAVRGAGVGTGRVIRDGAMVHGSAVESAAAAAGVRPGVWVDARTGEAVRQAFQLELHDDGPAQVIAAIDTTGGAATEMLGPFVGRTIELALLARVVDEATRTERPRGAIVLGAPGMGKSRLEFEALKALRRAEPRATVIRMRGEAFRRESPFAALKDALAEAIDPGVASLFVLREGDAQAELDRARASLETLLEGRADHGPIMVVVDDAQWLDAPSRDTIRWLAENSADLPLALWIFARPEARESLLDFVAGAQLLELGPLADDEAASLLRAVSASAPAELVARAGGNPLFLGELGRWHLERGIDATVGSDLPVSIEGALMAQLDQLPAADREYLKRAAIFGEVFWSEGVRALGAGDDALPRLRRADLVESRRRSRIAGAKEFAFRAAMCRDVAYGLWTGDARTALHGAAGEWLASSLAVAPAEVARHFDLAGNAPRAAVSYAEAAEVAARAADVASACRHVDRVLALTTEARIRWRALVARDDALQLSGDIATQRKGIADLEALAAELGPSERAEAQWRKCYVLRLAAENDAAMAAGLLASDLAVQLALHRLAAQTQIELSYLFVAAGKESLAREYADRAGAQAERTGDVWLSARADAAAGVVCMESGQVLRALELFERAAGGFSEAGDRRREALLSSNAASAMLDLGRVEEAAARVAAALEASRRVGNARTAAAAQHTLGVAERMLGRLEVARAMQDRADQEAAAVRHTRLRAAIAVERGYLALASRAGHDETSSVMRAIEDVVASPGGAALRPSAAAVVLRLASRLGVISSERVDALRAQAANTKSALLRVEIAIALLVASDGDVGEVERVRATVDAWVKSIAPAEEDIAACREAIAQRFVFDATTPDPRSRSALESVIRVLKVVG